MDMAIGSFPRELLWVQAILVIIFVLFPWNDFMSLLSGCGDGAPKTGNNVFVCKSLNVGI